MNRKIIAVDIAALVGLVVVLNPAVTGVGLHEWVGLGAFALLFVHCVQHFDWIAETIAGMVRRPVPTRVGNFVLDALILVALVVVMLSGLLVSGAVLPSLGLFANGYYFWDPLHAISAKVLLALLLVHVAVHGKWLLNFFRRGRRIEQAAVRAEEEAR